MIHNYLLWPERIRIMRHNFAYVLLFIAAYILHIVLQWASSQLNACSSILAWFELLSQLRARSWIIGFKMKIFGGKVQITKPHLIAAGRSKAWVDPDCCIDTLAAEMSIHIIKYATTFWLGMPPSELRHCGGVRKWSGFLISLCTIVGEIYFTTITSHHCRLPSACRTARLVAIHHCAKRNACKFVKATALINLTDVNFLSSVRWLLCVVGCWLRIENAEKCHLAGVQQQSESKSKRGGSRSK